MGECLNKLEELLKSLAISVDLDGKVRRLKELDQQSEAEGLWEDAESAQKLLKARANLQSVIQRVQMFQDRFDDLKVGLLLAKEEGDDSFYSECAEGLRSLLQEVEKAQLGVLLSAEGDENNAFVEINSGAGGTEAQDWVAMLARMYSRWAEQRGFPIEVVDETPGEEAGFKSIALKISGYQAFGWLKTESGVHRLVRISPFDANARRHTSFASVYVYPETDDNIQIDIDEKDLKIDTYRSSGAGGQHINKTDSAIRITHLPTGLVVSCQVDRSQHRNRAMAMNMLKSRLYDLELKKRQEDLDKASSAKTDISWGNQIRSYVLQPYQMVKDTRTGVEIHNAQSVLDGDIDSFLEASLIQQQRQRTPQGA